MTIQIFISYSHENTALLRAFVDALRPVARQRGWEIWYDVRVAAGRHLDETIKDAIAGSNVFLCFVTQSFLNSKYILEEELPRIREAAKTHGALYIPVVVENCFWKTECDGPRAVPLDPRGKLRAVTGWSPRSKGHHAACEQVIAGIDDHFPSTPVGGPTSPPPVPEDEPGPRFRLVGDRFDIVDAPPPEFERADPKQIRLHERLCSRIERLGERLEFYKESLPDLHAEFADYRGFVVVDLADLDVAALLSAGNGLSAMVEAFHAHDPRSTNTPALEPQVEALLRALLEDHLLFVAGFEEGKELLARAAENRLSGEDQRDVRDRTEAVLAELDRPVDLFGDKAKTLVSASLRALRDGEWSFRDLVETSAALAANGVIGMGREVTPYLTEPLWFSADEAPRDARSMRLEGDVPPAVRAAIGFFSSSGETVAKLAVGHGVLRFVEWLGGAARTFVEGDGEENVPSAARGIDEDMPPPDFDLARVHEMILRGEDPPKAWARLVMRLDFSGAKGLEDLSPLVGLSGLTSVDLSGTSVADLSPLAGLGGLTSVSLSYTSVTDLSPLAGLGGLTSVDMHGTSVTDLSPLAGLGGLKSVDLSNTSVTDLSPLASLGLLMSVNLSDTPVSDLSPLAGLGGLTSVDLAATSVSDLSPLAGLGGLTSVDLSFSLVSDLSPLARLGGLASVDLSYTLVDDLSPLAGLGGLRRLSFSGASVTDLSPLSGVAGLLQLEMVDIAATDLTVIEAMAGLSILRADGLRGTIRWPRRWPRSLEQLNLFESDWPVGRPLPDAPWRIDPDGTVRRGEGKTPFPFRWWAADVEHRLNPPPPPPEG